jgi:hypothetical protein
LGKKDAALVSYDRALTMRPDYAEALYHRGNVLLKPEWLALLLDREVSYRRDRRLLAKLRYAKAVLSSCDRRHRLPRCARSRSHAIPKARRERLDRGS